MRPFASVLILTLACGFSTALAQQEQPDAPKRRLSVPPVERDDLKARLERRLNESKRAQERLEAAINKLDAGADATEILRELDLPGARSGRGDGPRRGEEPPHGEGQGDRPPRERGPGRPDDLWAGFQPGRPMSDEMRAGVTDFLREHLPELAVRIDALREIDPEGADRLIARIAPRMRDASRVRQSNPKLFELRLKELQLGITVLEAVKSLRTAQALPANAPERTGQIERATNLLRERLTEQSAVRNSLLELEIESLAARLDEMRKDLERKRAGGAESVEAITQKIVDMKEPRDDADGPPRRKPE